MAKEKLAIVLSAFCPISGDRVMFLEQERAISSMETRIFSFLGQLMPSIMLQGLFIIGEGTCIFFGKASIEFKEDVIVISGITINRKGRIIIAPGSVISVEGTIIIASGSLIMGQSGELFPAPKERSERTLLSLVA